MYIEESKNIKVKYNKQHDNTIQSYSRLQCSQYSEWPVMLINSIQRIYHDTTAKQPTHSIQKRKMKRKT